VFGDHVNVADEVVGALTVSVTATVFDEDPVALTVMVPLWGPAASPVVFTTAVNVLLLLPDAGLTLNHEALSLTVQFNVPPIFVKETVWLAGFVPPCVAVYVRLVGLKLMVEPAVTVNITGTVMLDAPVALRVIFPL